MYHDNVIPTPNFRGFFRAAGLHVQLARSENIICTCYTKYESNVPGFLDGDTSHFRQQ